MCQQRCQRQRSDDSVERVCVEQRQRSDDSTGRVGAKQRQRSDNSTGRVGVKQQQWPDDSVERICIEAPAAHSIPLIKGFYSNVRSLPQASGDVRKLIPSVNADVFFLTETHLKDDPIKQLIPSGYKAVARLDRTKHGGGLIGGTRSHLLANLLDLSSYNIDQFAEMIGFELDGVDYIGCYTPDSHRAQMLIRQCRRYLLDHPDHSVIFIGDFNAHNTEWLHSTTNTDAAGTAAQEFCESFDLHQLVDFPTRGGNTLDLILSSFPGSARALANPGSSDHVAIGFEAQVISPPADTPDITPSRDWDRAPWNHIRGAIKKYLSDWDPCSFISADEAQSNLNEWFEAIIERYV